MEAVDRTPARAALEVLLFSVDDAGRLVYRRCEGSLYADEQVDEAALAAAGLAADHEGIWNHSTSWHRDDAGNIVLTYAVLIDPDPSAGELRVVPLENTNDRSESALSPSPTDLSVDIIARHAAEHLAFLLATGTTQLLPELPEKLLAALSCHQLRTAGEI